MATALAPYPLDSLVLEKDLIDTVVANAKAVDKAELDARYILKLLAEQGKISVGVPATPTVASWKWRASCVSFPARTCLLPSLRANTA